MIITQPRAPASSSVDTAIDIYNELLELPVTTRALLSSNTLILETSHRSLSQLSKRSASQTIILSDTQQVIGRSPLVFTAPEVQHTSYSPDGIHSAVFRAIGPVKDRKLLIEIWDCLEGVKVEEVAVGKAHGDFYFDS